MDDDSVRVRDRFPQLGQARPDIGRSRRFRETPRRMPARLRRVRCLPTDGRTRRIPPRGIAVPGCRAPRSARPPRPAPVCTRERPARRRNGGRAAEASTPRSPRRHCAAAAVARTARCGGATVACRAAARRSSWRRRGAATLPPSPRARREPRCPTRTGASGRGWPRRARGGARVRPAGRAASASDRRARSGRTGHRCARRSPACSTCSTR